MKKIFLIVLLLIQKNNFAQSFDWLVKPEMDQVFMFGNHAIVTKNNQSGVWYGTWLLPQLYTQVRSSYPYFIGTRESKQTIFRVSETQQYIHLGDYDEVRMPEWDVVPHLAARRGKYWGFISSKANVGWVIEPRFEQVENFQYEPPKNYVAIVHLNGQKIQIDSFGNAFVAPKEQTAQANESWSNSSPPPPQPERPKRYNVAFQHNYMRMQAIGDPPTYYQVQAKNRMYGLVDLEGKEILSPQYNALFYLTQTRGIGVKQNPQTFTNQNVLIDVQTGQSLAHFEQIWLTSNDCKGYLVRDKGLTGFIDTMGTPLMAPTFHAIETASNHYFKTEKGLWGFLDCNGKEIYPNVFEDVHLSVKNGHWVKFQGKWGLLKMPTP